MSSQNKRLAQPLTGSALSAVLEAFEFLLSNS
jgi:hypothetical protein